MDVRILIIDDNPTFVAALRQFLDFLPGATVVGQARDMPEALAGGPLLRPDLVLVDVETPDGCGLRIARAMRAWPSTPDIMLLCLHDDPAYGDVARQMGARALAAKSDFVADLLPAIEALVRERQSMREDADADALV